MTTMNEQNKPTQLKASEAPRSACRFDAGGLMFSAGKQAAAGEVDGEQAWEKGTPYDVRLLVRTREPVKHWYWYGGKVYHELSGMHLHGDRITMDYEHSEEIGWLASPEIDKEGLWLSGSIIPTGSVRDVASDVIVRGIAGVPYEASIFFDDPMRIEYLDEGMEAEVNGEMVEGPCTIIRECKLRATAVCSHGADSATGTRFANQADGDQPVIFSVVDSQNTPLAGDTASMSKNQTNAKDSTKPAGKPANQQSDEASASETTNASQAQGSQGDANQGDAKADSTQQAAAGANPAEQSAPLNPKQEFQAELKRFTDKFGIEQGAKFFSEGLSFSDALERDHTRLSEANAKLAQRVSGLDAAETEGTGVSETGEFSGNSEPGKPHKSAFRLANKTTT